MALKPQMDAWLATDPFTPQCHFEQDRFFAIGYPVTLASLNSGQYDMFNSRVDYAYRPPRWSPDGQFHVHVKEADMRSMAISTYDGEEIFSISDPQLSYDGWYWSPDSQMILYSTNTQAISVLEVYEFTGDTFRRRNFSDFASSDFPAHWMALADNGDVGRTQNLGWSRNGSYILFSHDVDTYVIDVKQDTLTRLEVSIPYSPTPIWWSDTAFYFVENQMLKSYDVSTNDVMTVTNLPNETTATIMVFGENTVGIIDDSFSGAYYSISHDTWVTLELQIQFVQWLEIAQIIVYAQETADGTIDYYQLDTEVGRSTLLFNAPTHLKNLRFSPLGQYSISSDEDGKNWTINPLTNIAALSNTQILMFDNRTRMNWFEHQGQDWLLVQEDQPNLADGVYMTYVIQPQTLNKCKVGLTDINLHLQPKP